MSQLQANENITKEMTTNTNNLNDHLVPLPIRVLREATVILENPEPVLLPPTLPKLERITSTYGKHSSAGLYQDEASDDLPPIPKLSSKKDIILEAYKQEILVCPGLGFHEDHYSGLPYDPIYLTHLNDDIRDNLNSKLPFPELIRQINYPSLANLRDDSLLDEMPAENPIFRRMDGIGDYKNI
jgi:hypothetical protein